MDAAQQKINDFVSLYRQCERPTICNDSFSYSTDSASENIVNVLLNFLEHSESDVTGLQPSRDSLRSGIPLSFHCQIPAQGFHETFEQVVERTPSLHKGTMPNAFYVREKDYLYGSDANTDEVCKIQKTVRLINFLKNIITHTESTTNYIQFILFTQDSDNHSPRKQRFESRYQFSDITNLSGLEQLEQIIDEQDLHREERFAILRNTLAEFLEREPDCNKKFFFILKQFEELKEQYDLNYETYINKFAFNKFEMEVVSKSDDLMQKLNSTMNDIVAKVLVAPAGVLALQIVNRKSSGTAEVIPIIAIGTISFILVLLFYYQLLNLNQIKENIETIFENLSNREEKALQIAKKNKKLLCTKRKTIYVYLWIHIVIVVGLFFLCLVPVFFEEKSINTDVHSENSNRTKVLSNEIHPSIQYQDRKQDFLWWNDLLPLPFDGKFSDSDIFDAVRPFNVSEPPIQ